MLDVSALQLPLVGTKKGLGLGYEQAEFKRVVTHRCYTVRLVLELMRQLGAHWPRVLSHTCMAL